MTAGLSISVVIPLYNKAAYITEAIQSVLQQRLPAMEVVVVDDGSTDDGPDRVRALAAQRVRLVSQANAGVAAARNHGITLATGDLVAFLDADDLHHPDYLATVALLSQRYPQAGVYCTGYSRVDAAGRRTDVGHGGVAPGASALIADFYGDWSRSSFSCTISTTVRRELLLGLWPPFPVGEPLGEDQDLWFRLAEAGAVAYCNRPLADYRVEVPNSATQAGQVLDPLPCYQRLAQRLASQQVPVRMQAGARRLLACHLINVARALAQSGQLRDAAALLRQPMARGNLRYWLRSAGWLAWLKMGRLVGR